MHLSGRCWCLWHLALSDEGLPRSGPARRCHGPVRATPTRPGGRLLSTLGRPRQWPGRLIRQVGVGEWLRSVRPSTRSGGAGLRQCPGRARPRHRHKLTAMIAPVRHPDQSSRPGSGGDGRPSQAASDPCVGERCDADGQRCSPGRTWLAADVVGGADRTAPAVASAIRRPAIDSGTWAGSGSTTPGDLATLLPAPSLGQVVDDLRGCDRGMA